MSQGICVHCTQGDFLPGEPKGILVNDGAYFASGHDASQSKKAIVLLTDIFGLPLKNCKIMADRIADRLGCDVWVPDMFEGVDELAQYLPHTPGTKQTMWLKLVLFWTLLTHLPGFYRNRDSVLDTRVSTFTRRLKEERKYDTVGVVGYCMGGSVAIRLATSDLFDTAVVAHPGQTSMDQVKAMNVPTSWVLAEEDFIFDPATRNAAEAIFAARKGKDDFIPYEFVDFKGTCHGFAERPNLGVPAVKEAFEKSMGQTEDWFRVTLKM